MSEPVMALHYRADAGSSLELRISLDSQIRHVCSGYGTSELVLEGQAPVYAAPPYYSCEQPIVYEEGKEHGLQSVFPCRHRKAVSAKKTTRFL